MSFWRQLCRGVRVLANRKAAEEDIADEVDHYLREATAAYIQKGLAPDEAERAARLDLGGSTAVREQIRGYGWENVLEAILSDLRYAARTLARSPGFAVAGVCTLALGIGASTASFSVLEAVLLRKLPYPEPGRIVQIWEQAPDGHRINLADANFDDFRTQNRTFSAIAVYGFSGATSVSGGSEPVRGNIAVVSRGFFEVFGTSPVLGRAFAPEEQRPHGTRAVIVSHRYWRQYLGGTPELAKSHLKLEGEAYQGVYSVIGVMPESFDFPSGVTAWISSELDGKSIGRRAHNWRGVGRIRAGLGIEQARADLGGIAQRIRNEYGKQVDLSGAVVLPLAEVLVGDVRTALLTLGATAGLLLLVACANVAGLLLARNSAQQKELAVRLALGAGRVRLLRQFLAESFLLTFTGAAGGVLLAAWAVRILPVILPADLPRREGVAMNTLALLYALTAAVVVAVALGGFAAWRAGRGDLQLSLTAGSRSYTGSGAGQRFRSAVVIGEIAATAMILTGAGLLARGFVRLVSMNPGFDTQHLITTEFLPPSQERQTRQSATIRKIHVMEDIVSRLRAVPGVESAGLSGAMPVAAGDNLAEGDFLILHGRKAPTNFEEFGRMAQDSSQVGHAEYCVASEGYFRTMGIPLIRGRMFSEQDGWNSTHVAVISETLARERWPNQDPIGETLEFGNMDGNPKPLMIIGIVGDVRASGLDRPPRPIIYVEYRQRGMNANSSPTIMLRSTAPVGQVVSAARGVFREFAPDVPVRFSTFTEEMDGWLADRRFLMMLVSLFGGVALVLASVGIYGVVAFGVSRRTQEIGVRLALGAQRGDVLHLVMAQGARLAVLGLAIGTTAAAILARLLTSLLFGIGPMDPVAYAAVAGLLLAVALLASYIPARRAMRLDPTRALRCE